MALKIDKFHLENLFSKLENIFSCPVIRDENNEFSEFLNHLDGVCRFLKIGVFHVDWSYFGIYVDKRPVDLKVLYVEFGDKEYRFFKIDDVRAKTWRRQTKGKALGEDVDNIRSLLEELKEEYDYG